MGHTAGRQRDPRRGRFVHPEASPTSAARMSSSSTLLSLGSVFLRTEGARMTAKEKKASIDALVADLKAEDECGGEMAHAPSLDCAGMLVMGSNAYVTRNSGATTKTAWTVQLCEE